MGFNHWQLTTARTAAFCLLALELGLVPCAYGQQKNAPAAKQASAPDTVTLNFVNADLEAAVHAFGQFLQKDFLIDPRVKGTITISSEHPVTRAEAYRLLLAALRFQGFTIVESGGISKVIPEADAKFAGGPTEIPRDASPRSDGIRGDQIVTQVFHLNYDSASNMVNVLRPLVSANSTLTANPNNNSIVITDYAENLRRLAKIIASQDAPSSAESDVVQLQYALASDLAPVVQRLMEPPAGSAADPGQRVVVVAEPRINAVLLRAGSPARVAYAKTLIGKLDVPTVAAGNIHMVYLKNAEATKLAQTLRAVVSGEISVPQATSGALSGTSMTQGSSGSQPTGAPLGGGPSTSPGGASSSPGGLGGAAQGLLSTAASASSNPFNSQSSSSGGGGGFIQADAATNALIITAPEPVYRNLRAIIDALDVRRAEVFIESLIVEVTAERAAEFGIQWQALGGYNGTGPHAVGGTNFGTTGVNILGVAQNPGTVNPGLNVGVVNGQITIPGIGTITNLGFLARALESDTNTNILSTPNLLTLDNEEASIVVGQNVPFVTGQYAQTGTTSTVTPFQTITYQDVGLTLRVRPQVSDNGTVKMVIYQEVSSISSTTSTGNVITNKRALSTDVQVDDGQIIVLGGLVQDSLSNEVDKVPGVGNVPVVGNLFKYQNRSRTKTNLMVFLRPHIVRDDTDPVFADKYEMMRKQQENYQPKPSGLLNDMATDPMVPLRPPGEPTPMLTPPSVVPVQP
ncbi:MAG: type II secretion system secretin GspD [Burkholderiaceae bacterium]|jgi:general secretion pathway protein D